MTVNSFKYDGSLYVQVGLQVGPDSDQPDPCTHC